MKTVKYNLKAEVKVLKLKIIDTLGKEWSKTRTGFIAERWYPTGEYKVYNPDFDLIKEVSMKEGITVESGEHVRVANISVSEEKTDTDEKMFEIEYRFFKPKINIAFGENITVTEVNEKPIDMFSFKTIKQDDLFKKGDPNG